VFVKTIDGNVDSQALRAVQGRTWPGGVDAALPLKTAGLYLSDDTLGVLDLSCEAGYVVTQVQMGFPAVRAVSWNRALADGTYDVTRFVGARTVSITLDCDGKVKPVQELVDRFRSFVSPRYRPWLCWLPVGASEVRRMKVRGVDAPLTLTRPTFGSMVGQFISAGDADPAGGSGAGLIESAVQSCRSIRPGSTEEPGRTYDLVHDRVYPPAGVAGAVTITNTGSAAAEWNATINGPAVNPVLSINGQLMRFTTSIVEGDSLVVDSASRTILSGNGEPRYQTWDFAAGAIWPVLNPGPNQVRWQADADSTSAVSEMRFCWRNTWT
jgi:hypothetical protein